MKVVKRWMVCTDRGRRSVQELKIRPIENSKNRVTNYEILNYAGVHQYRYLNKREFDLYTHQTEYEAKVKFSNDLDSKIDRLTDQIRDMSQKLQQLKEKQGSLWI